MSDDTRKDGEQSGDASSWQEDCDHPHYKLNHRAFMAVKGASHNAASELIALLRSDAPIMSEVRELLAQALDGGTKEGMQLTLTGNLQTSRRWKKFNGRAAREQWAEIGEWITARRAEGQTRERALDGAADVFASSRKKCEAALTYYERMDSCIRKWWDGTLFKGQNNRRELLEAIYHTLDMQETAPPIDAQYE